MASSGPHPISISVWALPRPEVWVGPYCEGNRWRTFPVRLTPLMYPPLGSDAAIARSLGNARAPGPRPCPRPSCPWTGGDRSTGRRTRARPSARPGDTGSGRPSSGPPIRERQPPAAGPRPVCPSGRRHRARLPADRARGGGSAPCGARGCGRRRAQAAMRSGSRSWTSNRIAVSTCSRVNP
jgi:hypothetical protein